jgi:hypothetical protein
LRTRNRLPKAQVQIEPQCIFKPIREAMGAA